MDISLRSDLRFPGLHARRFAGGLVLAACAGMSVAVHVGMLASVPSGGGGFGSTRSVSEVVFHATLIPAVSTVVSEPSWTPPDKLAPIASRLPRAARMEAFPNAAWTPPPFDESAYLRASQLTVRPSAAEYIAVPYPKDAAQDGTWRTTLAIFIDEDGTAARVQVVGARLLPAFEGAALAAFGRARFNPGKVGETPVKSRMLVQVEFANDASDALPKPRLAAIPGKR